MSGGEAEGDHAYDREVTHQEGHNESERTEDNRGLLRLAESASSQSFLQMSKRQKKLKGRQLQQTKAWKAWAAKRWAQQPADGAAERAADRLRAEKVAAERKAASARPVSLPDIGKKWSRPVKMAPATLDKAFAEKDRKATPEPALKFLGGDELGKVGGSWGLASVRHLEGELREGEKARRRERAQACARAQRQKKTRRAAAASLTPEQTPGSVMACGGMWVQRVVAHLGDMSAGISRWFDGAVRGMVTQVAGNIQPETLSAGERPRPRRSPVLQVGCSRQPAGARRVKKSALKALRNETQEKSGEGKPPAAGAPAREHVYDDATAAGQMPRRGEALHMHGLCRNGP